MKAVAEWIVAILFMLIIVVFWLIFFILMSPVYLPVKLASKIKEEATILGVSINFKGWAYQMVVSQDQTVNTILGGNMDTHVSGRTGFHAKRGNGIALKMESVIDLCFKIFFKQENHCREAIEHDEAYSTTWGV